LGLVLLFFIWGFGVGGGGGAVGGVGGVEFVSGKSASHLSVI